MFFDRGPVPCRHRVWMLVRHRSELAVDGRARARRAGTGRSQRVTSVMRRTIKQPYLGPCQACVFTNEVAIALLQVIPVWQGGFMDARLAS